MDSTKFDEEAFVTEFEDVASSMEHYVTHTGIHASALAFPSPAQAERTLRDLIASGEVAEVLVEAFLAGWAYTRRDVGGEEWYVEAAYMGPQPVEDSEKLEAPTRERREDLVRYAQGYIDAVAKVRLAEATS